MQKPLAYQLLSIQQMNHMYLVYNELNVLHYKIECSSHCNLEYDLTRSGRCPPKTLLPSPTVYGTLLQSLKTGFGFFFWGVNEGLIFTYLLEICTLPTYIKYNKIFKYVPFCHTHSKFKFVRKGTIYWCMYRCCRLGQSIMVFEHKRGSRNYRGDAKSDDIFISVRKPVITYTVLSYVPSHVSSRWLSSVSSCRSGNVQFELVRH